MAGAQGLPLQLARPSWRRDSLDRLIALLGASVVVFCIVSKPPIHAGYTLAGFLLWLLGVARLLLFGQIGQQHPLIPGALGAAAANVAAAEKLKHFFFGRQEPAPV